MSMAEQDEIGLPPVETQSLLSADETELLAEFAKRHGLLEEDLTALLKEERRVQGMGRRHGIFQSIQAKIAEIAQRRMDTES